MELIIKVSDYLSEDEVKDVIQHTIQNMIRAQYSGSGANLHRLITNLSYYFVWEMVDRQYNGEFADILQKKIIEVIESLSSFSVFRRRNEFDKEDSLAYRILQEELANTRPLIRDKNRASFGAVRF